MATVQLTAEQLLSKTKVAIMNDKDWQWTANVIMMGASTVVDGDHQVQTAATDGLNEIYHRDFVMELPNERQRKFLVLHEAFHKFFRHMTVWQDLWKIDARLANIACDVVINNQCLIGKPGVELIEGGVDMPEYADDMVWDARKIFMDLQKKGKGQGDGEGGHDSHLWEEAQAMSDSEKKDLAKQIDAAIRQAKLADKSAGNMPRNITQLTVPEVDWRTLLADFVKNKCVGNDKTTWRKPHRTYIAHDLYMPSYYSTTVGRLAIFVDTSGSIGDDDLGKFMGFIQQLCDEVNPEGVDIAWWGTTVVGVDRFEKGNLTGLCNAVNPRGGGGTDPSCCAEWLKKEKEKNEYVAAIVITDGYFNHDKVGDWGSLPVLWLVVNGAPTNIKVGQTVAVDAL